MNAARDRAAAAPSSAALRSFEAQWRARPPDGLAALRGEAMELMLQLGLPGAQDESWRYTSLRPLTARRFVDAPVDCAQARAFAQTQNVAQARDEAHTQGAPAALPPAAVLLVNGHPLLPGSTEPAFEGLEIRSLRELAQSEPQLLAGRLAPLSHAEEARFDLLNKALFLDGLYIKIKSRSTAAPIVLTHLAAADEPDTVAYPRVLIEAVPGARATVIERHVCRGPHAPLSISAAHLALGRGAALDHYRIFAGGADTTHIDSIELVQAEDSTCRQFTVVEGGGLVRASLDARLAERGASLENYSLLVGHGERHVDCVNIARHSAPDTRSRQTSRALASGASRVIFNSKVVVAAGAVRSESMQSCRGLLLSPTAEIDSRPQLEIHTDEVRCAHGATTGRLDADMLFYLLARGLDRETAQSLLIFAFLAEVLTPMTEPGTRAAIEAALIAQLIAELPNPELLRSMQ